MADSKAKAAWMKENTVLIAAKLNRRTDADIIEAIERSDGTVASRVKELIRKGIEAEETK
jgi:hypothetical protein